MAADRTAEIVRALAERRYTSIADLELTARILRRPEAVGSSPGIRYARDLQVADLKSNNLIFLGAKHSNPWVELYEKDATFRIEHDEARGAFRILNTTPADGEPTEIRVEPQNLRRDVYGIVAFHRSPQGEGSALEKIG